MTCTRHGRRQRVVAAAGPLLIACCFPFEPLEVVEHGVPVQPPVALVLLSEVPPDLGKLDLAVVMVVDRGRAHLVILLGWRRLQL